MKSTFSKAGPSASPAHSQTSGTTNPQTCRGQLFTIWTLGWTFIMGLYRRQLWLKVITTFVLIYVTGMLTSYVWKPIKLNTKSKDDSLGYGFRKLLEDDDPLFEKFKPEGVERRLPQCIIFGVRKCGTRALLKFLDLHPQIRTADHEIHFFNEEDNYQKGLDWYKSRMPYSYPDQITIEKTPRYFIAEEGPKRVHAMNSSVKLIVIFRNPITRVISDFTQVYENKLARNKSVERFEDIVYDPVRNRINTGFKAIRISMYHYHLSRWLHFFPRRQIHVVDGDNLITNPLEEISRVEQFLGLDHQITENNIYLNETRGFYCMKNGELEYCLGATKGRRHPDIDPFIINKLRDFYQPYNRKLFRMIGTEFDWNKR